MSSYLFVLYADGFSSLINDATVNQLLNGIFHLQRMPYIVSRLFFSDDNLLFCNATNQECQKLIEILELLPQGQKINTNKSSIFFSNNTSHEKRSEMDILGPMQDSQQSKYLGLPFIIGNSKTEFFFLKYKKRWGRNWQVGRKN